MASQVSHAGRYIDRMDIVVNAPGPKAFGRVLLEEMAREGAVVCVSSSPSVVW
jgi:hypothetical protein